jgi:hypothetical protein
MKRLTREEILAAGPRLATEEVPVPEWGGAVLVRELTGAERDEFEESCYVGRGKNRQENFRNLRARLVALSVVDDAGRRLFSPEDLAMLSTCGAAALDRLFGAAQRLSGLTTRDVEELAGNSGAGQNGASTSA